MKIGIIDTGICNVRSIITAFEKINAETGIIKSPNDFSNFDRLVLPGVGSWDHAVDRLHSRDLWQGIINSSLIERKPILGICLGMQLLANSSEEGILEGLGLIPGKVLRMKPQNEEYRVPNVGWSYVEPIEKKGLDGYLSMDKLPRFYFVHSYHFCCEEERDIAMKIELDKPYSAVVIRENIWGAQFHPEKSHNFGLGFLKIWLNN